MGKRAARRPQLLRAICTAIAAILAGTFLVAGLPSASNTPAHAASAPCPASNIWVHTGGQSPNYLIEMRPNGTEVSRKQLGTYDSPLPEFGDIAFTPDGTKIAAIDYGQPTLSMYLIDPVTGLQSGNKVQVTGAITNPGPWNGTAYAHQFNALSAYKDGYLTSSVNSPPTDPGLVYSLTTAGVLSSWSRFPKVDNQQLVSGGDFLTLPNGDVLGIGVKPGVSSSAYLVRFLAASGAWFPGSVVLGSVPQSFGAALSGGQIYLAGSDGQVRKVRSLPAGGTASIATDLVGSKYPVPFYGAASLQDGGTCAVEATTSYTVEKRAEPSMVVEPGKPVTYSVTVRNMGETAYPAESATFTDNLSDVLDDATLIPGSVTSSAGAATVAGNILTWSGPLAPRGTAGAIVTVSYKVQVKTGATSGNYTLKNSVVATGPNGTCAVPGACSTTVTVQKPKTYSVRKSASPVGPVGGGATITYQIVVTNTGAEAYTLASPASFRDNLSDVLDDATWVGSTQVPSTSGTVSFDAVNKTLNWSGALAVNASVTITYSVKTLTTSTGNLSLVNTVSPTGVGGSCASGACSVTITVLPEWSVTKTASVNGGAVTTSGSALPGDTIDYTVTATGVRGTVNGARLHDAMGDVLDDATFVSGSFRINGGSATAVSPQSNTLTSPQFVLTAGSTAVMSYRVTVKPSAWKARIVNSAYGEGVVVPNRCNAPASTECATTHTTGALIGVEKLRRTLGTNVEPVSGATFAILTDAAGQPGAVASGYPVVALSAVGQYNVRGIPAGKYWLQETAAPSGQQLLAQPVPFTVAQDGTITIGPDSPQVTVSNPANATDPTISTIRVVDATAFILPASGGPGRQIFYLIGGAVLVVTVLAAGISTARKRKRSRLGSTEPS